jgi:hypothetical protein
LLPVTIEAVAEFDPRKPTVARVYDALIGGKDNFGPDREVYRRLDAMCPGLMKLVGENKDFLERAVTYVAACGVDQFIDLGAGIPRSPATHETAREVLLAARIAYVDNDPHVLAHLTAWYGNNDDQVTVVNADVADRDTVLAAVRENLDLTRPCGLILGMMLHFYPAEAARALVAAYLNAVAPGSFLIASSVYSSDKRAPKFWAAYSEAVRPIYPHSPEVFAGFFGTAELVPPGVGEIHTWRPGWPAKRPLDTTRVILCAVARTR